MLLLLLAVPVQGKRDVLPADQLTQYAVAAAAAAAATVGASNCVAARSADGE
jgi:hypothetical protein